MLDRSQETKDRYQNKKVVSGQLEAEGWPLMAEGLDRHQNFLLRKEIPMEEKKLPKDETPEVVTYTDEEIFEKLTHGLYQR